MPDAVGRRLLLAGAAWTVPVILVGEPAAAAACSPGDIVPRKANLSVASVVGTTATNGHSAGSMGLTVVNDGTADFAAGTSWEVQFVSTKAPSPSVKDIIVTPRLPNSAFSSTPATSQAVNPNNVGTTTFTITLTAGLVAGGTAEFLFDISTQTGVGATELQMNVAFTSWGIDQCSSTASGSQQTITAYWGQNVD